MSNIEDYLKKYEEERINQFGTELDKFGDRVRKPMPSFEKYMEDTEEKRMWQANHILATCASEYTPKYNGYFEFSAEVDTFDTDAFKGIAKEYVVRFPVFKDWTGERHTDTLWVVDRLKEPVFGHSGVYNDLGSIRFYSGGDGNSRIYVYESDDKTRGLDLEKDKEKIAIVDAVVRETLAKRQIFIEKSIGKKAIEESGNVEAYRFSVADSLEVLSEINIAIEKAGPLEINTQELKSAIEICDELKANYQVLGRRIKEE